eukprot:CAMPEP_0206296294 /NCGR_PEP_ID=MMETSP0106_2-20121207/5596_1 /ASSEMBLY_ACC=CAM_ASM_000206 /TAXON_ID=81532 /ORGANISM="Acanthoeca-like sp., Strain 10tr" /LENGTH=880 /DNA_ID=CAMNT_0053726951 /DNA_START=97 /DNA_END=2739 /DNA_ORIENTATION=-
MPRGGAIALVALAVSVDRAVAQGPGPGCTNQSHVCVNGVLWPFCYETAGSSCLGQYYQQSQAVSACSAKGAGWRLPSTTDATALLNQLSHSEQARWFPLHGNGGGSCSQSQTGLNSIWWLSNIDGGGTAIFCTANNCAVSGPTLGPSYYDNARCIQDNTVLCPTVPPTAATACPTPVAPPTPPTPSTVGDWSESAPLPVGLNSFGITTLSDGRVLVTGGQGYGNYTPNALHAFDPTTRQWTYLASSPDRASSGLITATPNGTVVAACGITNGVGPPAGTTHAGMFTYNVSSNTWSDVVYTNDVIRYSGCGLTTLPNGDIVIAGGQNNNGGGPLIAWSTAATLAPGSSTWNPIAQMLTPRIHFGMVTLPDGRVLAAGGGQGIYRTGNIYEPLASVEIWDPATNVWSPAANMSRPRFYFGLTTLQDGSVLAVGGDVAQTSFESSTGATNSEVPTSELYFPHNDSWVLTTGLGLPRSYLGLAALNDGRALAVGGILAPCLRPSSNFTSTPSTEIYTPIGFQCVDNRCIHGGPLSTCAGQCSAPTPPTPAPQPGPPPPTSPTSAPTSPTPAPQPGPPPTAPTPPGSGRTYLCDPQSLTCSVANASSGTFSSLTSCQASCAVTYTCTRQACVAQLPGTTPPGEFSSVTSCEASCRGFACDAATRQCSQQPYGTSSSSAFSSLADCQAGCVQQYSCDRATLQCTEVQNGSSGTSLTSCQFSCATYNCDPQAMRCSAQPYGSPGQYRSEGSCTSACVEFTCSTATQQCEAQPYGMAGEFKSLVSCQAAGCPRVIVPSHAPSAPSPSSATTSSKGMSAGATAATAIGVGLCAGLVAFGVMKLHRRRTGSESLTTPGGSRSYLEMNTLYEEDFPDGDCDDGGHDPSTKL